MRRPFSSLILLALLSSGSACAKDEPAAPAAPAPPTAPPTAAPATPATPATPASPTHSASRSLDTSSGAMPHNSNPAPTTIGAPHSGLIPVALVLADGKAVVMSEGRRASLRMQPDQTRWTGATMAVSYNGGVRMYGADEATWWQPGAAPANSQLLSDMLAAAGQLGDWVEVESLKTGQKRVWANVSGKRDRVGIFKVAPQASLYLLVPAPASEGKEATRMMKSSGFQFDDQGRSRNVIPTGATAAPVQAAPAASMKAWATELSTLRGAATTITWSTLLDLDRDGTDEGVLCVKGGKDDSDCYVVDDKDGVHRYFGLTNLKFAGGAAAQAPLAFTTPTGTYVMLSADVGDNHALWVARYDGHRYLVEGVR